MGKTVDVGGSGRTDAVATKATGCKTDAVGAPKEEDWVVESVVRRWLLLPNPTVRVERMEMMMLTRRSNPKCSQECDSRWYASTWEEVVP